MRGPFPARSRPRSLRALAAAAALATLPLLGGCKSINGTTYTNSDPLATGRAAARAKIFTDRSRSTSTVRSGGGTVVVRQEQTVDSNDVSGVIGGSNGGARRSSTSTLIVRADPTTCWILVVDGNENRGCGNASVTDTRGERAGRLIKCSGTTTAHISLVTDGQTVDTGQVQGINHYVTVRG